MIKLFKQFIKFICFSGIGWLLDIFVYTILSYVLKSNVFINNIISSLCGATFVFLISTRFVFANNHKVPLVVKYVIYIIHQIILIYLISKLLFLINLFIVDNVRINSIIKLAPIISKVLVTPITMCLNFVVSKVLIECELPIKINT